MNDPDLESYSTLLATLVSDGFLQGAGARFTPLAGGVSSNVLLVEEGGRRFVVKQALHRLKVKDEWFADVSRNRYERDYLDCVSRLCPDVVPQLLGSGDGYFVMEYLGEGFATWKDRLLGGDLDEGPAVAASRALGLIHCSTYGNAALQSQFDTTVNFHELRTDPYLLTTGLRHAELRAMFEAEAERLESKRECLVHGDYSPKNLLVGHGRLTILDCEVAWYGDPAFDLAFLLTHLLLKALYRAAQQEAFRRLVERVIQHYFEKRQLSASQRFDLEVRVARLLLMLMLARIDGKSPVEYLGGPEREFVRQYIRAALPAGGFSLDTTIEDWFQALRRRTTGDSQCK